MFKEIPRKNPRKNRLPLFGVGVNDAKYKTNIVVDGRRLACPFYLKWHGMLRRSYHQPYKDKNQTYRDVTVCNDWLTFSNFKAWMIKQDWKGKQLDKDILVRGNKVYSPDFCVFVDLNVNTLINDTSSIRGKYKAGVCLRKDLVRNKFMSYCSDNGRQVFLGFYATEDEAHLAYCEYKYKVISRVAELQLEPIKSALLNYRIT